jgi:predicted nucleotidyltransferase
MSLLRFLKECKSTRKVFGRRELEIIEKQLFGFNLTQSEKNRLSRDIRKKFEFIKEVNKFRDGFKLEKNQNNKKIIEKALNIILKDKLKDNIKAVLLFGSFADNTFTKRSDIDICVVFNKDLSLKEATLFRIRVAGELPEKVDVQVFNILPQKIKREIARNHKMLYKTREYDNINLSIRYLKDADYFLRMEKIFGAET